MPKSVPVREFRTHLAELLEKVADRRERVILTRRGRPAAVLVPIEEFEALEETAETLSHEDTRSQRSTADSTTSPTGTVVPLEQVRNEHARP